MLNFFISEANICQYVNEKPELKIIWITKQSITEKQSHRPASDCFSQPKRLRIRSPENPDCWWTFQFPSVIVTSIIKMKYYYYYYYYYYYANTWQRLNSDWNTNEETMDIFIYIFVYQRIFFVLFYTTMIINVNLGRKPRRRTTCSLFLSLMVPLFLSCRKLSIPGGQVAVLNSRSSTSLMRF